MDCISSIVDFDRVGFWSSEFSFRLNRNEPLVEPNMNRTCGLGCGPKMLILQWKNELRLWQRIQLEVCYSFGNSIHTERHLTCQNVDPLGNQN